MIDSSIIDTMQTESRKLKVCCVENEFFMGAIAFLINVNRDVYNINEAHAIDARCQSWTEREVRFLIRMKKMRCLSMDRIGVHGQYSFFDKNQYQRS